jgi:hypothetical protein
MPFIRLIVLMKDCRSFCQITPTKKPMMAARKTGGSLGITRSRNCQKRLRQKLFLIVYPQEAY